MYLDEDILCLQEISELVHLDMGKHLAAVVSDVLSVARRQSEALNLQSECYFNAGVLLINVHQWLKQNISEKALSLLSDRSKNYVFFDQAALNLILDNAKKILPQKWNFISEKHEKTNIPKNTILLHCAANPKPWDIFCYKKTQTHQLYYHYESLSPWSGLPLRSPSIPSDARIYSEKFLLKEIYIREYCGIVNIKK